MSDNGWDVYDHDETNPFFRESNRPRKNTELQIWLSHGGTLSGYLAFKADENLVASTPNAIR